MLETTEEPVKDHHADSNIQEEPLPKPGAASSQPDVSKDGNNLPDENHPEVTGLSVHSYTLVVKTLGLCIDI